MYYIGIDLGGTNIAAGIVDDHGKIIVKGSVPTIKERNYTEIIADMAKLAQKLLEDAGLKVSDVKSIGIGSPGTPDSKNGILVYSNNLSFENVPMRDEVQKYLNLPVYIDNDANVAALAESVAGAAKGVEHSVAITIGTGIGGGVVINGKVYNGFNSAASEIGHSVIVKDGEPCTCGRKGCWEAYASATACIRQTKEAAQKNPDSIINKLVEGDLSKIEAKTLFDAAKQGDEVALETLNHYIEYLAEGLINVINIFQPEILVIGGGVCRQGDYLLNPLRELINKYSYSAGRIPHTAIKVAEMENDAGIVGAAMLGK